MPTNDLSIKIAGEAGQGVESGGAGFAKAVVRGGLYVFGVMDYMSRIRGGHNFYQVRVGEHPLHTFDDAVHLLLAFNKNAVDIHTPEVVRGGGILHDAGIKVDPSQLEERGIHDFEMPLIKIAEEQGGHKIMMNTAALGATAGITSFDFDRIADIIETNFKRKGAETVQNNLKVARAAGCRFISACPMPPASTITEWLAAHAKRFGVVQKHTEDETAAILFAIG